MVGIVVIAHQNLAHELIRSAQHIMGSSESRMAGVAIDPEIPFEKARRQLDSALDQVRGDDGAIILTDMYGGTPANLSMDFLEPGRVEVIAGVNLPMLVRLLTYRSKPLEEQVQKALDGGREGIVLGRSRAKQPTPPQERP